MVKPGSNPRSVWLQSPFHWTTYSTLRFSNFHVYRIIWESCKNENWLSHLGWSLTLCISNKPPGVAATAGPPRTMECHTIVSLYHLSSSQVSTPISAISSWKEQTPKGQRNLLILCFSTTFATISPPLSARGGSYTKLPERKQTGRQKWMAGFQGELSNGKKKC